MESNRVLILSFLRFIVTLKIYFYISSLSAFN